jgi:hypothetical protein
MKKPILILMSLFAIHFAMAQKLEPDFQKLGKLLRPKTVENNPGGYPGQKSILTIEELKGTVAIEKKIKEIKNTTSQPFENSMPIFIPERMETMPVYVPETPKHGLITNPGKWQ